MLPPVCGRCTPRRHPAIWGLIRAMESSSDEPNRGMSHGPGAELSTSSGHLIIVIYLPAHRCLVARTDDSVLKIPWEIAKVLGGIHFGSTVIYQL
jgi:hypothetical protein